MNRIMKGILLFVFYFVITIFLIEIGVRVWGYAEHYIYEPVYMPFSEAEDIPFIHKPGLTNAKGRGGTVFSTDSLGLRSVVSGVCYGPKKNNEHRIAVVGDSITFGEGVKRTKDVFCRVLEDTLRQENPDKQIHVFNFGVSAYSVKEMTAVLKRRMLQIEPDVVLMAISPTDLDLSRTGVVDKWGYTANSKLSGFMPKDSIVKRLLRNVRLVYVLRDINYARKRKKQAQDYKAIKDVLPESYKYIKQFKEIAEEAGCPYLIVILPTGAIMPEEILRQLRQDRIHYRDLSFIYNEFKKIEFRANKFDRHPGAPAHKRIGKELAKYLSNIREKDSVMDE